MVIVHIIIPAAKSITYKRNYKNILRSQAIPKPVTGPPAVKCKIIVAATGIRPTMIENFHSSMNRLTRNGMMRGSKARKVKPGVMRSVNSLDFPVQ